MGTFLHFWVDSMPHICHTKLGWKIKDIWGIDRSKIGSQAEVKLLLLSVEYNIIGFKEAKMPEMHLEKTW